MEAEFAEKVNICDAVGCEMLKITPDLLVLCYVMISVEDGGEGQGNGMLNLQRQASFLK